MKRATVSLVVFMAFVSICVAATNVNSLNVVGYKKVATTGNVFKILGVNFEKIDSTNDVFTISDLLPSTDLPGGTTVYIYNGLGYVGETYWEGYGWDPNTNKIYRGDGFWFLSSVNLTNAFLGEVPSSDYAATTLIQLSQGFQFFAYPYPVSIALGDTDLGAVAQQGDTIYAFSGSGYVGYTFWDGFGWDPDTLVLEPGAGYWFYKQGAGSVIWTESKPYVSP